MDPNEIRAAGERCKEAGYRAALAFWDFNVALAQAHLNDAERGGVDPKWGGQLIERARRELRATQRKRDRFARTGSATA